MNKKYCRFFLCFCISAMAVLPVGCAASREQIVRDAKKYKLPYPAMRNRALVYVIRSETLGALVSFHVHVNNPNNDKMLAGSTKGKQYIYFYINPGYHTIYSQAENQATISFQARAGAVVFINQTPLMGVMKARNQLSLFTDIDGKYNLQYCSLGTVTKKNFP